MLEIRQINCPLCESDAHRKLLPTLKYNFDSGSMYLSEDIWLTICENCALIYENPAIAISSAKDYAEKHYYNDRNPLIMHNVSQAGFNPFRWHFLQDRLNFPSDGRALDIGASGSWSNWLKRQYPASSQHLVEPSGEAIAACKELHPDVTPFHGVYEDYRTEAEYFDLITFYYSLYVISSPLENLKKAYRELKPGGTLLVCISHVMMNCEIWSGSVPWVNMNRLVRGVPVVYYTLQSLKKMLAAAGFEAYDEFVGEHPEGGVFPGRQEYFVLARKSAAGAVDTFSESAETIQKFEEDVILYCERASSQSVQAFVTASKPERIIVAYGDETYRGFVEKAFADRHQQVEYVKVPDVESIEFAEDAEGTFILNATETPLTFEQRPPATVKVINCIPAAEANTYGLWVEGNNGRKIMTKAFAPCTTKEAHIFPFDYQVPVNEITGPKAKELATACAAEKRRAVLENEKIVELQEAKQLGGSGGLDRLIRKIRGFFSS